MTDDAERSEGSGWLLDVNPAVLGERVERSEAVSIAILETAVDPIILIDTSGIMQRVNRATGALFGYTEQEMVGQNVSMLMPEPYRSEHDRYIDRYLTEGDPRIIGIGREVQGQKADGTIFPMSLAVSEARTEFEYLFTGIIHDLTERNRQRDALEAANRTLEERVSERTDALEASLADLRRSNRDLEQFAYIASHDLQAPLRNVRQGLELLDEHLEETVGTRFDDEADELRELVLAAVLRMESLIKGLLEYSRVQRDPVEDRTPHDLTVLVRGVVEMLEPEIDAISGSVTVSLLPTVAVNEVQFRQVFQNLIENAIRYRAPERDLAITVTARSSGEGRVMICVQDNGTGIEDAHHARIFELFRRGHSGYDGDGLGLAICQRVIEGHDGRIWVESDVGHGATFCMELPAEAGLPALP